MDIVIGSRGSALALWQANWVRERLALQGHDAQVRVIRTAGDEGVRAPLQQSGVKGLFVKEIEEALAGGAIDLAVHSLKDLPTEQPPNLMIAAVSAREDARDVLISRTGLAFDELPAGARLATSWVRRESQLRNLRPDLEVAPMRGNVDTRLRKLDEGQCDALVLAAAGLVRLGFESRIRERFAVDRLCPAAGQGALAIEARKADGATLNVIAALDDLLSHHCVRAERALVRSLGGGCSVPIAAHAWARGQSLEMLSVVASPNGKRLVRASQSGPLTDPEGLGAAVARQLLSRGAGAILEASPAEASL